MAVDDRLHRPLIQAPAGRNVQGLPEEVELRRVTELRCRDSKDCHRLGELDRVGAAAEQHPGIRAPPQVLNGLRGDLVEPPPEHLVAEVGLHRAHVGQQEGGAGGARAERRQARPDVPDPVAAFPARLDLLEGLGVGRPQGPPVLRLADGQQGGLPRGALAGGRASPRSLGRPLRGGAPGSGGTAGAVKAKRHLLATSAA
mmetsp:Transcript_93646/g.265166  ORF Transcript_93646/g.265166 Transcript_93646/m.265166 type:complete len:200 (+) Transcript_93646:306-905(+)